MAAAAPPLRQDFKIIAIVGAAHGGSHYFHLVLPPLFPRAQGRLRRRLCRARPPAQRPVPDLGPVPDAGRLPGRPDRRRARAGVRASPAWAPVPCWPAWRPATSPSLPAAILMGLGNSVFHPADYAILGHHVARRAHGARLQHPHRRRHASAGRSHPCWWPASPPCPPGAWPCCSAAASALGSPPWCSPTGRCSRRPPIARRRTWRPVRRWRAICACSPRHPILLCFLFFALQATSFIALQGFMPLSLHQLFGLDMVAATATGHLLHDRQRRRHHGRRRHGRPQRPPPADHRRRAGAGGR